MDYGTCLLTLSIIELAMFSIFRRSGGLSKALLMRKENGREVVAKIPCRIAGPARLTTASEVGVLQYGMSLFIPFVLWVSKLK